MGNEAKRIGNKPPLNNQNGSNTSGTYMPPELRTETPIDDGIAQLANIVGKIGKEGILINKIPQQSPLTESQKKQALEGINSVVKPEGKKPTSFEETLKQVVSKGNNTNNS